MHTYFVREGLEIIVEMACDYACLKKTLLTLMLIVFTNNNRMIEQYYGFTVVAINHSGITTTFKLFLFFSHGF